MSKGRRRQIKLGKILRFEARDIWKRVGLNPWTTSNLNLLSAIPYEPSNFFRRTRIIGNIMKSNLLLNIRRAQQLRSFYHARKP